MTGFARADGVLNRARWHWELRSVNGRGLDLRFRLPTGLEMLEPRVREVAQRRFARGSLSATLSLKRDPANGGVRLNEAVLAEVLRAAERIRGMTGGELPDVASLLNVKGVLEIADAEDDPSEELGSALLDTFEQATEAVVAARRAEGARLETVMLQHLDAIEAELAQAAGSPARSPQAIAGRIADQISKLISAAPALDPDRLHQEAVLIATRVDIEEEVNRLTVHIAAARDLLAGGGVIGRKLDFLAQEFNREANTLCSKANDPDITRAGLAMKSIIDQMREQIQNIE